MAKKRISGFGGARKQLQISLARLFLDPNNPRLPEDAQGKEEELLLLLHREFDIGELAFSMAENGYFDEEPLVAIPKELPAKFAKKSPQALKIDKDYEDFLSDQKTQLTVVEGNRRLAAIKILVDSKIQKKLKIRSWPQISKDVQKDLETLPVIVYSNREEVLPYLGVRHIVGVKKWEPFAKARYIGSMLERELSLQEVEKLIGDRSSTTRRIYVCYRLIKQAEKAKVDTTKAKQYFSYLLLAIGQSSIKNFLGLSGSLEIYVKPNPIPAHKMKKLKQLLLWLFGNSQNKPVIRESREITSMLSHVLESNEALKHLIKTNNLSDAFEYTAGEETMLLRNLSGAMKNLKTSFGLVRKYQTVEVKARLKELKEMLDRLLKEI